MQRFTYFYVSCLPIRRWSSRISIVIWCTTCSRMCWIRCWRSAVSTRATNGCWTSAIHSIISRHLVPISSSCGSFYCIWVSSAIHIFDTCMAYLLKGLRIYNKIVKFILSTWQDIYLIKLSLCCQAIGVLGSLSSLWRLWPPLIPSSANSPDILIAWFVGTAWLMLILLLQ